MKRNARICTLILAGLLLLVCTACDGGVDSNNATTESAITQPAATTVPGPFAAARRILTYDDLRYDNENKPIIEQGEVLVNFHYMDTLDAEAWQASTIIQVAWAVEAIDHTISLDRGMALHKSDVRDGSDIFSHAEDYGFGIALNETWMLPKEAFTAAFNALMAEAKNAGTKDFWLVPNNYSGILNPTYNPDTSFRINSYLPEQLRPNAEAIHMSTELMRKHFPFLGQANTERPTLPTTTEPVSKTRPDIAMSRKTEHDGLVLQIDTGYQHQYTGEPFTLTATVTNTTGKDITYGVGSGTPNMHMEIQVSIYGPNTAMFVDMDTYGKVHTDDYRYTTLKAGETFTQTIRFLPGTPTGSDGEISMDDVAWFPAGEHEGEARFTYFTGTGENPGENPGEVKHLQLSFPVILI